MSAGGEELPWRGVSSQFGTTTGRSPPNPRWDERDVWDEQAGGTAALLPQGGTDAGGGKAGRGGMGGGAQSAIPITLVPL